MMARMMSMQLRVPSDGIFFSLNSVTVCICVCDFDSRRLYRFACGILKVRCGNTTFIGWSGRLGHVSSR
ncbi:hypothetical protein Hanom_Chr17g01551341 [Helianthus anomalus]